MGTCPSRQDRSGKPSRRLPCAVWMYADRRFTRRGGKCDADFSAGPGDRRGTAEAFSSGPELVVLNGWAPWARANLVAGGGALGVLSCAPPLRLPTHRRERDSSLHCPAICDNSGLDHGHVHGQRSGF